MVTPIPHAIAARFRIARRPRPALAPSFGKRAEPSNDHVRQRRLRFARATFPSACGPDTCSPGEAKGRCDIGSATATVRAQHENSHPLAGRCARPSAAGRLSRCGNAGSLFPNRAVCAGAWSGTPAGSTLLRALGRRRVNARPARAGFPTAPPAAGPGLVVRERATDWPAPRAPLRPPVRRRVDWSIGREKRPSRRQISWTDPGRDHRRHAPAGTLIENLHQSLDRLPTQLLQIFHDKKIRLAQGAMGDRIGVHKFRRIRRGPPKIACGNYCQNMPSGKRRDLLEQQGDQMALADARRAMQVERMGQAMSFCRGVMADMSSIAMNAARISGIDRLGANNVFRCMMILPWFIVVGAFLASQVAMFSRMVQGHSYPMEKAGKREELSTSVRYCQKTGCDTKTWGETGPGSFGR